jgi:hypothetical protein
MRNDDKKRSFRFVRVLILLGMMMGFAQAQGTTPDRDAAAMGYVLSVGNQWSVKQILGGYGISFQKTFISSGGMLGITCKYGMYLLMMFFLLQLAKLLLDRQTSIFDAFKLFFPTIIIGTLISSPLIFYTVCGWLISPFEAVINQLKIYNVEMITIDRAEQLLEYGQEAQGNTLGMIGALAKASVSELLGNLLLTLAIVVSWIMSLYFSVMWTLFLVVGPLLVPCLIFAPLSSVAWNWLKTMISYPMMCLMGMILSVMMANIGFLSFATKEAGAGQMFTAIASSAMMIVCYAMIPTLGSSIVGGISSSFMGAARTTGKVGKIGGGAAVATAGAGLVATGAAMQAGNSVAGSLISETKNGGISLDTPNVNRNSGAVNTASGSGSQAQSSVMGGGVAGVPSSAAEPSRSFTGAEKALHKMESLQQKVTGAGKAMMNSQMPKFAQMTGMDGKGKETPLMGRNEKGDIVGGEGSRGDNAFGKQWTKAKGDEGNRIDARGQEWTVSDKGVALEKVDGEQDDKGRDTPLMGRNEKGDIVGGEGSRGDNAFGKQWTKARGNEGNRIDARGQEWTVSDKGKALEKVGGEQAEVATGDTDWKTRFDGNDLGKNHGMMAKFVETRYPNNKEVQAQFSEAIKGGNVPNIDSSKGANNTYDSVMGGNVYSALDKLGIKPTVATSMNDVKNGFDFDRNTKDGNHQVMKDYVKGHLGKGEADKFGEALKKNSDINLQGENSKVKSKDQVLEDKNNSNLSRQEIGKKVAEVYKREGRDNPITEKFKSNDDGGVVPTAKYGVMNSKKYEGMPRKDQEDYLKEGMKTWNGGQYAKFVDEIKFPKKHHPVQRPGQSFDEAGLGAVKAQLINQGKIGKKGSSRNG